MQFSKMLKAKRKEKKLSISSLQCEIARAGVDVSVQSVYNWEAGINVPNPVVIKALNEIFNFNFLECFQ